MHKGISLLRQLLEQTANAEDVDASLYAAERLRFVLETPTAMTIVDVKTSLALVLGEHAFSIDALFKSTNTGGMRFFVYSPDKLERTLPADVLFAIAAELRTALSLISCEPDSGDRVFSDPEPELDKVAESAVTDLYCWAPGEAPSDHLWALKNTRVLDAWALAPGKGAGIVIAQPDTGITKHAELADIKIDRKRTANILEGGSNPTDPLKPGMANPGHGSGTISVVASGEGGLMSGAAPKATLVPIRCTDDVKILNGAPVAKAIDHAISVGAHIITMSLGGLSSRAIHSAVRDAVARDTIVLAAAGNCVGLVVWPAAYSEVIAVGGTNVLDRPWRGSSEGAAVAFAAPAEFVWRAERRTPDAPTNVVSGGQGTSFATALTAGIAALWLDRHGRAKVIAEARRRSTVVQELFRAAARQTARRPAGYPDNLGAGIIDASALLKLPLSAINLMNTESAPSVSDGNTGLESALTSVFGPGKPDPQFDWAAYGAELSAILLADARAGRSAEGAGIEARAWRQPSADLAIACDRATDPRLAKLALRTAVAAPSIFIPPAQDERVSKLVTRLGVAAVRGTNAESAAGMTVEQAQAALDGEGRKRVLSAAKGRAQHVAGAQNLIDGLDDGMAELTAHGANARIGDDRLVMLEALVALTERPALPVVNRTTPDNRVVQTYNAFDPALGKFEGLASLALPDMEARILPAIGRIDAEGNHLGTGFVVRSGRVLTNRHVLELIAAPMPSKTSPRQWVLIKDATIDFSPSGFDPGQRFRVNGVSYAGANPILNTPISLDNLDLAVLEIEPVNAAGNSRPQGLDVSQNAQWRNVGNTLSVVGYPAPPQGLPRDEKGEARRDVLDRLREIFGLRYHQKCFSPGEAMVGGNQWVFPHDATTLGGNSGSAAISLTDGLPAVGLHFAGDWMRANFAHDLAKVCSLTPELIELLQEG